MTAPTLKGTVLIADIAWPTYKAVAVLVALIVCAISSVVIASGYMVLGLTFVSGSVVWWALSPSSPLTR